MGPGGVRLTSSRPLSRSGFAGKDTGVLAHASGIFSCFEKQKGPRRRETSSALVFSRDRAG